jgi:hypothetical protein
MLADQARRIITAFADYPLPVRQEIGRSLRSQAQGTTLDTVALLGNYLADGYRSDPESPYQLKKVIRLLALSATHPDDAVDRLGDEQPWRTVREAIEAAATVPDECALVLRKPPDPRLVA